MGPSNQLVPQALFSAFWIYGQVFSLLRDVFKLKCADEFREIFDTGGVAFGGASRGTGHAHAGEKPPVNE